MNKIDVPIILKKYWNNNKNKFYKKKIELESSEKYITNK